MPLLKADLDSPWCDRLELSDAAPGGHGRAWARFPEGVIIDIARYADVRKVHTSLNTEFGIEVDAQYRCPLFRVEVPFSEHWNVAPRPGGHSHITLEEADATIWSLESHLHRTGECGTRVLHGGDNAPQVASFMRGRSSSRRLNGKYRRAAAVVVAGRLMPFYFWVSTHKNIADAPSRVYSTEKKNKWAKQPNSFQDVQPVDLRRGMPERDRVLTFEMQPGIPLW
ncbi:unnamed protein product [Polarella glacialis]|uniref:Uncharacterized protein n=1 Tax=Polarella glacialis TaxID=89957 RepID=A0A813IE61_POLGL|nr:unnamed protein product [Polarella glacialis]